MVVLYLAAVPIMDPLAEVFAEFGASSISDSSCALQGRFCRCLSMTAPMATLSCSLTFLGSDPPL